MIFVDMFKFMMEHPDDMWTAIRQQLILVSIPMVFAILVAVPLTILSTRIPKLYPLILGFSNGVQTIPSLALLALMITLGTGIGLVPSVIALFVYSLMPIVRNTYVGIIGVAPEVKQAAIGMGATNWQLLWLVEIPLALKVIIAGIRTSLVGTIGFATLGALIGAGGLGDLILRGLSMSSNDILLAGTLPAVLMAFLAEYIMGLLQKVMTPKGIR